MPSNTTSDEDEANGSDVTWRSLSVFFEPEPYSEYDDFFILFRADHPPTRDIEKRVIEQAIIEVAMNHPEEVAEKAIEINERVGSDTEWEQANIYLPQRARSQFNDVFLGQLKVEHGELNNMMKRVLQEAGVIIGMQHDDEIAERAIELDAQYPDE